MSKLEEAGYIAVEKTFKAKKPNIRLYMTDSGRKAFMEYRKNMKDVIA